MTVLCIERWKYDSNMTNGKSRTPSSARMKRYDFIHCSLRFVSKNTQLTAE